MLRPSRPAFRSPVVLRITGLVLAALGALAIHAVSGGAVSAANTFHDAAPPAPGAPLVRMPRSQPSIIGDDDRAPVADTTQFPYSAVASLELYDEAFTLTGTCTGTFIGPDALLTAAHCLWRNAAWTKHIRVIPGKNAGDEPFGAVYGTDWWVPTSYIDAGEAPDFDWGLVRVPPDAIAGGAHWLPVTVLSTDVLSAPDFQPTIAGYPADKDDSTMWRNSVERFDTVGPHSLRYAIDTSGGESGAAIWSSNPARGAFAQVIGVHTRGIDAGGANSGARIDDAMLADLRSGCAEVHCTIDVASSPPPESGGTPLPRGPFHAIGIAIAQD